jgi:SAM-dependent methyltransferase
MPRNVAGAADDSADCALVRAEDWDQRYADKQQWSSEPNRLVASLVGDLPPGDAVDLAAGEGRHALWLADHGWRVTAVDFSDVGRARGRAQPGADRVSWVTADVLAWQAPPESLDLVLLAYFQVPAEDLLGLLRRSVGWLRPGGRLLSLGHDVDNLTRGVGGPQVPEILHSVERLSPVAALLEVDRLEQVARETPEGVAIDTLLWGRRPA